MAGLGNIVVELMVRLGEGEPQSLGFVHLPLTVKSISNGTIEGNLRDVVEYVSEDLAHVFGIKAGEE